MAGVWNQSGFAGDGPMEPLGIPPPCAAGAGGEVMGCGGQLVMGQGRDGWGVCLDGTGVAG